jgi:ABC-type oligopeptide transport system ATPase subunit
MTDPTIVYDPLTWAEVDETVDAGSDSSIVRHLSVRVAVMRHAEIAEFRETGELFAVPRPRYPKT